MSSITSIISPPSAGIVTGSQQFFGGPSFSNPDVDRLLFPVDGSESLDIGATDICIEGFLRVSSTAADNNQASGIANGAGASTYQVVNGNLFWDRDRLNKPRGYCLGLSNGRICFGIINASSASASVVGNTDARLDAWIHYWAQRRISDGLIGVGFGTIAGGGTVETLFTGPTGDISHPGTGDTDPYDRYLCGGMEKANVWYGCRTKMGPQRFSRVLRYPMTAEDVAYTVPSSLWTPDADTAEIIPFSELSGTMVEGLLGNIGTMLLDGAPNFGPVWSADSPFV